MDTLNRWLNHFDVKGRVWLGLWSVSTMAMTWFCVARHQDLPTNALGAYVAVLGAYAYNRTKNDVAAMEAPPRTRITGIGPKAVDE